MYNVFNLALQSWSLLLCVHVVLWLFLLWWSNICHDWPVYRFSADPTDCSRLQSHGTRTLRALSPKFVTVRLTCDMAWILIFDDIVCFAGFELLGLFHFDGETGDIYTEYRDVSLPSDKPIVTDRSKGQNKIAERYWRLTLLHIFGPLDGVPVNVES